MGIYRILVLASLLMSLNVVLRQDMTTNLTTVNEFSVLLPVFVNLYDAQIKVVQGRRQRRSMVIFKTVYAVFYYLLMLSAYLLVLKDTKKSD